MALNQKAIKVLGKVFEAGFTDEKSIAAMTMDDILAIQGITIADISIINELQKSIKANKVISFFSGEMKSLTLKLLNRGIVNSKNENKVISFFGGNAE